MRVRPLVEVKNAHEPHVRHPPHRYSTEGMFVEFGQSDDAEAKACHAREGGEHLRTSAVRSDDDEVRRGLPHDSLQLADGAKDGDSVRRRRGDPVLFVDDADRGEWDSVVFDERLDQIGSGRSAADEEDSAPKDFDMSLDDLGSENDAEREYRHQDDLDSVVD